MPSVATGRAGPRQPMEPVPAPAPPLPTTDVPADPARGASPRRITIEVLLVLAVAGLIAVTVTWPLAANFGTVIIGGGTAGDSTGYLWDIWSGVTHGLDVWGGGLQQHVGWPFGRTTIGGANLLLLTYVGPGWVLASFLPTIVAYNIITLSGLALAGASMYLLIRWLGLGVGAAAWAGVAYEIFPYIAQRSAAFPPLGIIVFAPLLAMAGIWWIQRPSWRRALVLAAAVLLGWISNPYYGAMALVGVGVILIVGAVLSVRSGGWAWAARRLGEALGFLVLVVGIPLLLVVSSSRGVASAVATRQRYELDLYGARIEDYFLPLPDQFLWSGIFGAPADWPFVAAAGERVAFLGWSTIALALLGLVLAWVRRSAMARRERIAVFVAVPLALAAGIFSLASPYRIFGLMLSMPSSLVFDYLPFLRVYARFALVVMVAVIILGAIGLSLVIRGRSVTWRLSWVLTAIIISAMELPLGLPIGTGVPFSVNGKTPEQVPTWQWLARNDPGAPVIETPAFPTEVLDRKFLYGQTVHDHPLANGGLYEPGVVSDFGREYGNPLFPAAATAYSTAGIRYVVINPWAWEQTQLRTPDVQRPPEGYRVQATFPDGSAIWRVTAPPAPAFAFPGDGWMDPTTRDGVRWRWMHDDATFNAWAPRAAEVTITFRVRGRLPDRSYTLAVTAPDGSVTRVPVGAERTVRLRTALPQGRSTFRLSASGAPAAPAPPGITTSVGDRLTTLEVSAWTIR